MTLRSLMIRKFSNASEQKPQGAVVLTGRDSPKRILVDLKTKSAILSTLMSVTEIEAAITRLPASNVRELMVWFEDYYNQLWDKEIEADLASGKLE